MDKHSEIRPFGIEIRQADLDDLRDRLARTRWPDQLAGVGWDYGIPLDYVRELAEYWRTGYDWRVHEARLNEFDQFTTTIDGQRIHFLHVRSAEAGALPLIITHGWPGSIVEFMNIIGPLTDPAAYVRSTGSGYFAIQSTRPQTLAYGLTDSPAGQLAWITEKFGEWTDGGLPDEAVDRDQLLTNVTLYWLTGTAGSAARLYYEAARSRAWGPPATSTVPTGVAVFPREIAPPVRRFAELSNNIVHWSEFDRGGHFAAMEVPDLLVGDVREFFRPLRPDARLPDARLPDARLPDARR